MILLLVIGEKSAYKKESRERERERERERKRSAQKSNSRSLVSSSFEKKFTSFTCKNFVCCLERHALTNQNLPISTAHQSSIHRPL